ncbi:hypothetical protein VP01_4426g1 [Puccinia sorghi]|uniref:Uncharacterized protein n=1 Tax=Puccinia sorghi TaxID=27349 RepID=A0A0L6UPJ5_9BASI|nr:hypothetical protein VP01_4426g1 [Puccinia sorghi]
MAAHDFGSSQYYLFSHTNHPNPFQKEGKAAKNPLTFSQSTLDPSSCKVIYLAQDLEEKNSKVKCKPQRRDPVFDDVKNSFSEKNCSKGHVIYLWFGSLIISYQVPTSVGGTRRNSMYLESVCRNFGLIKMALLKLEECQTDTHNVIKPLKRVPSFLPLLCRKQKILTMKPSTTSSLCGIYIKQSLGAVLKTRSCKQPFTTVKRDHSCAEAGDNPPVGTLLESPRPRGGYRIITVSYIWTFKRPCSIAWNYETDLGSFVHWSHFFDNDLNYVVQHLSLKLVNLQHKGSLLAKLIVNVFAKHGLQRKITQGQKPCIINFQNFMGQISLRTMIQCILTPPSPKLKEAFLGSVPYSNNLKPISEETKRKTVWKKRDQNMMLIPTMLMRNRRIWKKKMIIILARRKKRMPMIPIIIQVKNPTKRRLLPQTETNPKVCMN